MSNARPDLELIHIPAQGKQIGPPLLFIHGGFHGAWCWADHFMPWFSEHGFDCHAVSYRDHGKSARTERHDEWRLKDYVDDVRWAAAQLRERPILVGHSLDGSIAQKLAAEGDYPGMILLAPSPIGGSKAEVKLGMSYYGYPSVGLNAHCSPPRILTRPLSRKARCGDRTRQGAPSNLDWHE